MLSDDGYALSLTRDDEERFLQMFPEFVLEVVTAEEEEANELSAMISRSPHRYEAAKSETKFAKAEVAALTVAAEEAAADRQAASLVVMTVIRYRVHCCSLGLGTFVMVKV